MGLFIAMCGLTGLAGHPRIELDPTRDVTQLPIAADEPTSSRSPRLAIYRTTEDGGAFATSGQLLSDWTLAIV